MTDNPIVFAQSLRTRWAPCYNLVSRWLHHRGVTGVPNDSRARRWWMRDGPEEGLAQAAIEMRLIARAPQPGDVAVISQGDNVEPILGLIAFDSFVVARAFGVVAVGRPKIIRAWGMPWEKSSAGSAPPSSPPSPS